MKSRMIDILIPRYHEDFSVLKPLLDSIAIQQSVDFNDIGVIITDDGEMERLDTELFKQYPYKIEYLQKEHGGVSACRNYCLDHSKATYVMFCDADDMFYNACGLWIVFREIENGGFDSLVSAFVEETKFENKPMYINHDMDSTFVHGKFHKRKYLTKNKIRFNDNLTIHEDSFFNILAQNCSANVKYCQTPFYLWKWRDDSVCRHDQKYILKTYNNMLDSNDALVDEFVKRGMQDKAMFYSVFMIFDAYYTMNKPEWVNQENQEFRDKTELRFKSYYLKHKDMWNQVPINDKMMISNNVRARSVGEGMLMESITIDDWLRKVENL